MVGSGRECWAGRLGVKRISAASIVFWAPSLSATFQVGLFFRGEVHNGVSDKE